MYSTSFSDNERLLRFAMKFTFHLLAGYQIVFDEMEIPEELGLRIEAFDDNTSEFIKGLLEWDEAFGDHKMDELATGFIILCRDRLYEIAQQARIIDKSLSWYLYLYLFYCDWVCNSLKLLKYLVLSHQGQVTNDPFYDFSQKELALTSRAVLWIDSEMATLIGGISKVQQRHIISRLVSRVGVKLTNEWRKVITDAANEA